MIQGLSPAAAALIALAAAIIALHNGRKQIAASIGNMDKQLAAQRSEAARDRKAQLDRELRAERRDALVNAARSVHTLQDLAVQLHWMRASARAPEIVSADYSVEMLAALAQQVATTKSELNLHASVLNVLGLGDAATALSDFQYAFTDYSDARNAKLRDVSEVTVAARATLGCFADSLRIDAEA